MNIVSKFLMAGLIMFAAVSCKNSSKDSSGGPSIVDPACNGRTTATCGQNTNCNVVNSNCIATAAFCNQFKASSTCGTMASCTWDATANLCSPPTTTPPATQPTTPNTTTADSCSSLDQAACLAKNATDGCQWNGSCYKGVVASTSCSSLVTASTCTAVSGCGWNGTICSVGTNTCNTYTFGNCLLNYATCTWKLTQFMCIPRI